jgi:hypothetical protein
MVQVAVCRDGELEGAEANVVCSSRTVSAAPFLAETVQLTQGLVINAEGLVRVLDKLVHGKSGVVGLDCIKARSSQRRSRVLRAIRNAPTVSET